MTKKFAKMTSWALALLLGSILGCGTDPRPVEYGTPAATLHVSGKVVRDSDGSPVKGVLVTLWGYPIELSNPADGTQAAVSTCIAPPAWQTFTEEDGTFRLQRGKTCYAESCADGSLEVEDIDGEENGGDFLAQSVNVEAEQTVPPSGNWNQGVYELENLEIRIKEEATETPTIPAEEEEE